MTNIADICQTLARVAPLELAESWDNVGLLTGDASADIRRAMTCLSISDLTAAEAIAEDAQLIVTHHPLPFRPVARLTCEQTAGRLLWQLTRAGVAIYSAHTAWDSAAQGINEQIAAGLHLEAIEPLRPIEAAASDAVGAGRWGRWPTPQPVEVALRKIAQFFGCPRLRHVSSDLEAVEKVAIACGSAGEFLPDAIAHGCQLLVTGETSFHTCLEAEARGVLLVLLGHYASERFAMDRLAEQLADRHEDLTVWASHQERDPIVWRTIEPRAGSTGESADSGAEDC